MAALPLGSEADTVRAILADPRYQKQLAAGLDFDFKLPRTGLPWFTLSVPAWLWVVAGIVLVGVIVWRLMPRESDRELPPRTAVSGPSRTGSLEEAQRLAAAGRHVEAVHALLLLALEEWRPAAEYGSRELTSREVLRALPASVPDRERAALWELVRMVEWSWFGGRSLGETDYETALTHCRLVVERLR